MEDDVMSIASIPENRMHPGVPKKIVVFDFM
jgi:hypothetical protein